MKIAYKIFKNEIEDLLIFYNSTLIAYEQTKKLVKNSWEIENNIDNVVVENLKDFSSNTNSLEYDLRQLLLIKLISILEQYLIDNIKFIFTEIKEPFKTNNVIEFQHQELLSFKSLTEVFNKIISKDCRQLSSGGFDKIIKYYHLKFKLNLNSFFPSKERIIEYHDRRHLHVHNLGKTDKQYRKKYNTTKSGISISDEYIRNAIEDISIFAEIVNKNTVNYIENQKAVKEQKIDLRNIWFSFQNLTETLEIIDDNYGFWSNDDLVTFKDILIEKKQLFDNFVEVKICGEQNKIKDYYNIFKKTSKTNPNIKFFTKLFDDYSAPEFPKKVKNYTEPLPKIIITDELIKSVENKLPNEPWEIGIHKRIAQDLNQSNKTINRVINIILENRNKSYS
ncbi:hypothetical protein [Flavobacterium sp.]|uniref:hypothetical protein n=1 Tax=Flavobacterium sp. TaxID=239 RepID=UPI0038FC523D